MLHKSTNMGPSFLHFVRHSTFSLLSFWFQFFSPLGYSFINATKRINLKGKLKKKVYKKIFLQLNAMLIV